LRIVNAAAWVGAWLATAFHFQSFGDPGRLLGEAVGAAFPWLLIDLALRPKRQSKPLAAEVEGRRRP
jgi:hypothetical protein